MGCVCQESFLCADRIFQTSQQVIHRRHQWRHFKWYRFFIQGAEVIRFSGANTLFQFRQRLDTANQGQPHQQNRQGQNCKLREHHPLDNFGSQNRSFFSRFCHLNQHRACSGWRLFRRQLNPGVGHTHFKSAHFIVANFDFETAQFFFFLRLWQISITTQQFVLRTRDLVINQVGIISSKQFTGWLRQVKLDALLIWA